MAWKNKVKRGGVAEKQAQQYLSNRGLRLIQCNYRCRWGEIDIIASDGERLVFVEVRSRWSNRGNPREELLAYAKKKRLRNLVYYYLQKEVGQEVDCRLDLLTVEMNAQGEAVAFQHFKGVF